MADYDLVNRGGTVVDRTRLPVAPGVVDLQTHYDAQFNLRSGA